MELIPNAVRSLLLLAEWILKPHVLMVLLVTRPTDNEDVLPTVLVEIVDKGEEVIGVLLRLKGNGSDT